MSKRAEVFTATRVYNGAPIETQCVRALDYAAMEFKRDALVEALRTLLRDAEAMSENCGHESPLQSVATARAALRAATGEQS